MPGDAYRYTIQPVFQNIKTEFQCHIELQRPHDVLYELFFFVQIPGIIIVSSHYTCASYGDRSGALLLQVAMWKPSLYGTQNLIFYYYRISMFGRRNKLLAIVYTVYLTYESEKTAERQD